MDLDLLDRVDRGIEVDRVDQRLAGDHAVERDPLIGVALAVGADLRRAREEGCPRLTGDSAPCAFRTARPGVSTTRLAKLRLTIGSSTTRL